MNSCSRCGRELAPGAVACDACNTLVHADELSRMGAQAKALESQGQLVRARDLWLRTLPLLPPNAAQAAWVQERVRALDVAINTPKPGGSQGAPSSKWKRWLGPLAPLAVLAAKAKSLLFLLFKLKFLLSFASFIAVYWALFGAKFGIGFAVLILVHEMGHFIDIKRRGLPVDMPVFLPGLGAYVRWQNMGVPLSVRAAISLAGPLAGWLGAVACTGLWMYTHQGVWAALAYTTAWLNALNLVPVAILDGGHAALALSKAERGVILVLSIALAWVSLWFLAVAAGFAWRLFTKDDPPAPSIPTTAYYASVLGLLAAVMWMVPNAGIMR